MQWSCEAEAFEQQHQRFPDIVRVDEQPLSKSLKDIIIFATQHRTEIVSLGEKE